MLKKITISMMITFLASASFAGVIEKKMGLLEFEEQINYIELVPDYNGKFAIYISTDSKRFYLVKSRTDNSAAAFNYTDAKALKADLLEEGRNEKRLVCSSHTPKANAVLDTCIMAMLIKK